MKNYTLSLISGTNFTISLNGTALTTAEFAALLINNAGSAQFTPDADAAGFTIWDSSAMDGSSMTSSESITNGTAYEGTWSAAAAGATTNSFTTFTEAEGVAMTKYQISDLMGKIKAAGSGGDIPVYVYKLSEMRHETHSGSEYYALPNGIDDFKTGIYYFLNDTGANISRSMVRFTIFLPSENSSHYGMILSGTDYNTGQISDGQYESVAIHITWISSSDNPRYVYYTAEDAPGNNSSNRLTGYMGYYSIGYLPSTGQPVNSNIYDTGKIALIASSELTRSSSDYANHALNLAGANTLYRTIRGDTGSNNVRAWTSIGTGSRYTKRALQTTLNIAETGLTGLTANDWNTLFTLPANYYPNAQLTTGCTMTDNGTLVNGLVKITTGGAVQVMAGSNTTEVYGLVTIPVAS